MKLTSFTKLIISLLFFLIAVVYAYPDTLYEYCNTYTGSFCADIYIEIDEAQTFTTNVSHTVTFVKLYLYRVGSPGQVTVRITDTYQQSGENYPNLTSVLATAYYDGNSIPTTKTWIRINLTSEITLESGKVYAIVVNAPNGDPIGNYLRWMRSTSNLYNGGKRYEQVSGQGWVTYAINDLQFEVWGNPLSAKTWHDTASWNFNLLTRAWHNTATWTLNLITRAWHDVLYWNLTIVAKAWHNIIWHFTLTIPYLTPMPIPMPTPTPKTPPIPIIITPIIITLIILFIFKKR